MEMFTYKRIFNFSVKIWISAVRRPAEEEAEGRVTITNICRRTAAATTTTRTTRLTTCIIPAVTSVRRRSWPNFRPSARRPVSSRRRRRPLATWRRPLRRRLPVSASAPPESICRSTSALTSPASLRSRPPLPGPLPPPTRPGTSKHNSQ